MQQGKKYTFSTKAKAEFEEIKVGDKNNPITIGTNNGKNQITGLSDNLPTSTDATKKQTAPTNPANNVATVNDVLNTGWNLQTAGNRADGTQKDEDVDFVKSYDTVEFVAGAGLVVDNKTDGKKSEITYRLASTDLVKAKEAVDNTGTAIPNSNDGSVVVVKSSNKGNGLISANNVAKAINQSGWHITSDVDGGTQEGTATKELIHPSNTVTFKAGDNLVINQDKSNFTYKLNKELKNLKSVSLDNGVALNQNGIHAGDKKITGVAKGDINPTSTDAVNGSQIHNIANKNAQNVFGGNASVNPDGSTNFTDVGGTGANNIHDAIKNVATQAKKHTIVKAGKNVNVVKMDNNGQITYQVSTKDDIDLSSVTTGGVSMSKNGINAGGTQISNVSAGVADTDAVNVAQLKGITNNFDDKLNQLADDANSGTASAMAMAGLPQAYIAGKSMAVGATSYYNGQGAVAIGLSKVSDNGRWVIKTGVSADTGGEVGGTIGAGMHF